MAARNRIFKQTTETLLMKGRLDDDTVAAISEKITKAMENHHQKKLEGKILV